jgi:MFS family permease
MLESLFNPLHVLVLLFLALIVLGIPLLFLFLLAQWLDKRLQRRPGVRVSVVAVVIGGITDVVSSSLLAIPAVIYVMVHYNLLHDPHGSTRVASAIHSSAWLYGLQLTIGMGCSVLGGYVAAWIAKHHELLNGSSRRFCAWPSESIRFYWAGTRARRSSR